MLLFLAGDVMTGRGVDQILGHPRTPELREPYVDDARTYVDLVEARHGRVAAPVDDAWPWGATLRLLDDARPDARVVNVETSVTSSDDFAPGKSVHYRMHPANVGGILAARPDVCALANNHVLDFGVGGLVETVDTLRRAGTSPVGAGVDAEGAASPGQVQAAHGRVLVWSVAAASSGVPATWAASRYRPGVAYVREPSEAAAARLGERIRRLRRPGDLVVVSIHWGGNWGYGVSAAEVRFAHRLVDAGTDVVHGHSSHHPRPVEVYRGRLVLYGCGDLINDYEGIEGHEQYRDDLRLAYFASFAPGTGDLRHLRMVPLVSRRMRLERATADDTAWLRDVLNRTGRRFGSALEVDAEGHLHLRRR